MHDLRMWVLAYAPARFGNMQKLQEIYRLNAEMNYLIQEALWKRFLAGVALWFLMNKIFKNKFVNRGKKDSHEAGYRDTVAHI